MATPAGQLGLFLSSLDPQQSKSHAPRESYKRPRPPTPSEIDFDKRAGREAYRWEPAHDVETSFRHSCWRDDRGRVRVAMARAGVPQSRLERFDHCGSGCVVEFSPSLKRHRCRANYCGDRFCVPCARARASRVEDNVLEWIRGERCIFGTVTLRANQDRLCVTVTRLLRSFAKLRRHRFFASAVKGGCYVVEITRGEKGVHWHAHIHFLAPAVWLEQADLARAWHEITGDSFICDVRRVRDHAKAAWYIAKYATKGFKSDVLRSGEALVECLIALRGRRLFGTFGTWRGRAMDDRPDTATDWRRVGRLVTIWTAARDGKLWAVGILRSLRLADERAIDEAAGGGP